jgi:ABC-type multidrug transport system fused ATPase/permease subunit
VVTQEVQFFRGSLRQNLTMFDPQVPDKRILAAIDRLNLTRWLAGLPAGLDTGLSSSSLALSAGEAQRLALVRLFLRGPSIVILDEAAARLDPATELEVESALQELLDGCTGIVIAHRLKSVEKADDILILENGCVREYGDRLALMADPDSELNELLRLGLE